MELEGDRGGQDHVRVFGVKVDKTFTIANLVQITFLIFGLINGVYLIYFGLKSQFRDVSVAQDNIIHQQSELQKEIDGLQTDRRDRANYVDDAIADLQKRMAQRETENAVAMTNASVQGQRLSEVIVKIDKLDEFMRTAVTSIQERPPYGPQR